MSLDRGRVLSGFDLTGSTCLVPVRSIHAAILLTDNRLKPDNSLVLPCHRIPQSVLELSGNDIAVVYRQAGNAHVGHPHENGFRDPAV